MSDKIIFYEALKTIQSYSNWKILLNEHIPSSVCVVEFKEVKVFS
jgi:hypothetical protein